MASPAAAPPRTDAGGDSESVLRVSNSLRPGSDKVPFRPIRGRQVSWYICGPTVYDSAHVGHARTYLSFDIIRRILEDYFGYDVFYVMNVTDVDDKIIARARGDHLLSQYLSETKDPAVAVADVLSALGSSIGAASAKVAELKQAASSAATQKLREDIEEQLGQEELKLQQRRDAQRVVKDVLGPISVSLPACSPESTPSQSGVRLLLELSPEAEALRREKASTSLESFAKDAPTPPQANGIAPSGGTLANGDASAVQAANEVTAPEASSNAGPTPASMAPNNAHTPSVSEEASGADASVLLKSFDLKSEMESAVEQSRETLASFLVKTKGADVTDLSIFRRHAAKYEAEFLEDMRALGVRPPHVLTRVTEYIDKIIQYIAQIEKRGFAYVSNGSVYFDCRSFVAAGHEYGKLCPWAVDNLERAAESEANFASTEKKNKSDFALWKKSKPGEPTWDSPWGPGRPGWHIECSAMADDIIGGIIDIHSGGVDLRFPHHSNEVAQAEAYHDSDEWVKCFLHTGHLHIEGRKMSKSLKNFVTIREALGRYSARQIRMLFLMQAWDKTMQFGEGALKEAANRDRQFKIFFQSVEAEAGVGGSGGSGSGVDGEEQSWGPHEAALNAAIADAQENVRKSLQDNFDTASALLALLELCTSVNKYVSAVKAERCRQSGGGRAARPLLLQRAANFVAKILRIFGLGDDEQAWNSSTSAHGSASSPQEATSLAPMAQAFSAFRDAVRAAAIAGAPKAELLGLTDKVRDEDMIELGIRCEDRPGEARALVALDDPQFLRRERDERLRAAAEEAAKKLRSKLAARVKELAKWEAAAVEPRKMLADQTDKYSKWDANGVPTHDAAGKELSGRARKGVEKELSKQEEAHSKLRSRLQEEPLLLESLRNEIAQLEGEVAKLDARST